MELAEHVARRAERAPPAELFRALLDFEAHPHFAAPALALLESLLARAPPPPIPDVAALIAWGEREPEPPIPAHAPSWPARVAREHGPVGLTDGAWLHGVVRASVVEGEAGMALLARLLRHFGGPRWGESGVRTYASLLQSARVSDRSAIDLSYERALLGLGLGLFPSALYPETVGFDLWMAARGPCPLLEQLAPELRARGVVLTYLEVYQRDREGAVTLASKAIGALDPALWPRVVRGFAAADRAYRRWASAMRGANVPITPRAAMLEMIAKKAPLAVAHHRGVTLGDLPLDRAFAGDPAVLLDHLAASPLITPGAPDESPLIHRSISIDGPMFDVFTAAEQEDLRAWIAGLPDRPEPARPIVALEGEYTAPHDRVALEAFAIERYGPLPLPELQMCLVNADRHPAVRVVAERMIEDVLARLTRALDGDPRLGAAVMPGWSEPALAELTARFHAQNVEVRGVTPGVEKSDFDAAASGAELDRPPIFMILDGVWLQGFADVTRADRDEYGWLFRIYASEQGDGHLSWNHNRIARQMFLESFGPAVLAPATDRALFDLCSVGPRDLLLTAISLHTRRFLPELLGLNLGIEASGVGGHYIEVWKLHDPGGNRWTALSFRLHNAIDNFDSGHTQWSMAAIAALLARAEPAAVEGQWRRIWRLWRLQEIIDHGTEAERRALADHGLVRLE